MTGRGSWIFSRFLLHGFSKIFCLFLWFSCKGHAEYNYIRLQFFFSALSTPWEFSVTLEKKPILSPNCGFGVFLMRYLGLYYYSEAIKRYFSSVVDMHINQKKIITRNWSDFKFLYGAINNFGRLERYLKCQVFTIIERKTEQRSPPNKNMLHH